MSILKLGIIEDDSIIRESLETYLGANPDWQIVYSCISVESFLETAKSKKEALDILLLDIALPGMSGLDGIRHIKKEMSKTEIVILTTYEESDMIFKALCNGASSYLSKRTPLPKIREAIFTVNNGGSYMSPEIARKVVQYFGPKKRVTTTVEALTERQLQIIDGIVEGLSYKMIAERYAISINTVQDHIRKIYKKLSVNSKAEIIRKALDGEI